MRVIRLGDKTSHGGEVITAADNYEIMGKKVAREGDICTCPIPGHGSGGIIGGDKYWTINDRAVALQGPSKTPCGADIFSSCSELDRTFEGDGSAGRSGQGPLASDIDNADSEISEAQELEQFFVFVDAATGNPVNTLNYKIAEGEAILADKERLALGETIRFPLKQYPTELKLVAWV